MPKEILTRCGYRCDLCLAYKNNIETDDQRTFLSDTWHKLYGFRIPAPEIYCEGCLSSHNPKLIDKQCPIRPCVIKKGLENCSQCHDYPCDKYNQRIVVYENLLEVINVNISRKEYTNCIKPYENKQRLDIMKTQNGEFSRLLNPDIIPTKESITKYIEIKKAINAWTKLIQFMDMKYNLDCKIIYNGKKYGWAIQYKKSKKTIVTFYPERKAFTVLLTFGADDLRKIDDNKMNFSAKTLDIINNTEKLHDGKWIWIRQDVFDFTDDIISLIKIKRKPDNE